MVTNNICLPEHLLRAVLPAGSEYGENPFPLIKVIDLITLVETESRTVVAGAGGRENEGVVFNGGSFNLI